MSRAGRFQDFLHDTLYGYEDGSGVLTPGPMQQASNEVLFSTCHLIEEFAWRIIGEEIAKFDAEIDRLRDHVRSLHRLNGYSKQKGWWCSCGAWKADLPWERDVLPRPWGRRDDAVALHIAHVEDVLR